MDLKQNSKPLRPKSSPGPFPTDIKLFYRPSIFLGPIQTKQFLALEKIEPRTSLTKKWGVDQFKKNKGIRRFTRDNLVIKLKLILDESVRRRNLTLSQGKGSANVLKDLSFNRLKFTGSYSTLLDDTQPKTALEDLSFTQLSPTLTLIKLKDQSQSRLIATLKHLNKDIPECLDPELFVTTLKNILKKSFKKSHWAILKFKDSDQTLKPGVNTSYMGAKNPRKLIISGVRIKLRLKRLKGIHIRGYSYYKDKVYGFKRLKFPFLPFDLKGAEEKLYNDTELKLKSAKIQANSALFRCQGKRLARLVIKSPFGEGQPVVMDVRVKTEPTKKCKTPNRESGLLSKGLFLPLCDTRGRVDRTLFSLRKPLGVHRVKKDLTQAMLKKTQ